MTDADPPAAEPTSEDAASADLVRAHLAGRDVACPSCGYNLRDAPEPACPECSAELSLVLAARRDGITHYPRSAGLLDTLGQLGLASGLVLHALLVFPLVATLDVYYLALAGGVLLVALINGLLWLLWLRRLDWMGRQLPAVHVLLACAGWWWAPVWVVVLVTAL